MKTKQSIEELATQANEFHAKVELARKDAATAMLSALHLARQAGDALNKAKRRIKRDHGHGYWLKWLFKNFDASGETAWHYMRIAQWWHMIGPQLDDNPNLSIVAALRLLRRPRDSQKQKWPLTPAEQRRKEAVNDARRRVMRAFRAEVLHWPEQEIIYLARHCIVFNGFSEDFERQFISPIHDLTAASSAGGT